MGGVRLWAAPPRGLAFPAHNQPTEPATQARGGRARATALCPQFALPLTSDCRRGAMRRGAAARAPRGGCQGGTGCAAGKSGQHLGLERV